MPYEIGLDFAFQERYIIVGTDIAYLTMIKSTTTQSTTTYVKMRCNDILPLRLAWYC